MLMLTVSIYMLQVYDQVLTSRSVATLVYLTLIAVGALLVYGLLDAVRAKILVRVGEWLEKILAPQAFARSIKATLQAKTYRTESLRDVQQLRGFFGGAGIVPLFDAPWVPLYLFVIFALHPVLGMITLVGAVLVFACALANEFATRKPLQEANWSGMQSMQRAEAPMRAAEAIDAMGMTPAVIARWQTDSDRALAQQVVASNRAGAILAIAKFLRLSLQIAVLGAGAALVLNRELTAGAMIAASILTARALAPIEQSLGAWKQLIAARVAYGRLNKMFQEHHTGIRNMELPAQGLLERGVCKLRLSRL
ncbi:MAG: ABC transporter transmembrane domain-containing protein [Gammaproteobacteria bacterium]